MTSDAPSSTSTSLAGRRVRVDLGTPGPWALEKGFVDAPRHSPEDLWLRSVARDYQLAHEGLTSVLRQLALGWSIRTSLGRSGLGPERWNETVEALQRLADAGVLRPCDVRRPA